MNLNRHTILFHDLFIIRFCIDLEIAWVKENRIDDLIVKV